jgi:hypothetical protein
MKKIALVFVLSLAIPSITFAQNTPCSGKKGGISHCEGSKFVCNDGSHSQSKKDCSSVLGNSNQSNKSSVTEKTDSTNTEKQKTNQ